MPGLCECIIKKYGHLTVLLLIQHAIIYFLFTAFWPHTEDFYVMPKLVLFNLMLNLLIFMILTL